MRNENKEKIIELYKQGNSASKIHDQTELSFSTIYKNINQYHQEQEEEKRKIRDSLLFICLKAAERQAKTIIEITDTALSVIQKAFRHASEQNEVNIKDEAMLSNALYRITNTLD